MVVPLGGEGGVLLESLTVGVVVKVVDDLGTSGII